MRAAVETATSATLVAAEVKKQAEWRRSLGMPRAVQSDACQRPHEQTIDAEYGYPSDDEFVLAAEEVFVELDQAEQSC